MENIDINKAILKNIDIYIDIDKRILQNIDIDKAILKNIDIDINKEILENIDIDKILNQFRIWHIEQGYCGVTVGTENSFTLALCFLVVEHLC